MKNRMLIRSTLAVILLLFTGCGSVVSKGLRDQAADGPTFTEVLQNPDANRGKVVIWGGVIIRSENLKEGTLIRVLQKPTDFTGQPWDTDRSGGRFLALYRGFLDVELFSKGRELTVAGTVMGKRALPLGEIRYDYPLVEVKEIHLWQERRKEYVLPPPYWYYPPYEPWWWHHPYRHPHRYHR